MSKSLEEIIKEKDEIIFKLTKENLKLKEEILNKVLEFSATFVNKSPVIKESFLKFLGNTCSRLFSIVLYKFPPLVADVLDNSWIGSSIIDISENCTFLVLLSNPKFSNFKGIIPNLISSLGSIPILCNNLL